MYLFFFLTSPHLFTFSKELALAPEKGTSVKLKGYNGQPLCLPPGMCVPEGQGTTWQLGDK